MKQLTEAQLRKLIEDAFDDALHQGYDIGEGGYGLVSVDTNQLKKEYADKVLGSI